MMDKIPAALQMEIDYILTLDASPAKKAKLIEASSADYWNNNYGAFKSERKINDGFAISKDEVEDQRVGAKDQMLDNLSDQVLKGHFVSFRNTPTPSKPLFIEGPSALSRFLWAGEFGICAAISFVIGVILGSSL